MAVSANAIVARTEYEKGENRGKCFVVIMDLPETAFDILVLWIDVIYLMTVYVFV